MLWKRVWLSNDPRVPINLLVFSTLKGTSTLNAQNATKIPKGLFAQFAVILGAWGSLGDDVRLFLALIVSTIVSNYRLDAILAFLLKTSQFRVLITCQIILNSRTWIWENGRYT